MRETGTADWQPGSGRPRTALLLSQWSGAQSGGCTTDTQNWGLLTVLISVLWTARHGEWCTNAFIRSCEERWWAEAASDCSMVGNPTERHWSSIDQWRGCLNACVKAKGKHFEHFCGVFVHNYQLVTTFNAYVTVFMSRLTHVVFHKVV